MTTDPLAPSLTTEPIQALLDMHVDHVTSARRYAEANQPTRASAAREDAETVAAEIVRRTL